MKLNLAYATKLSSLPQRPLHQIVFSNTYSSLYEIKHHSVKPFSIRLKQCISKLSLCFYKSFTLTQSQEAPWIINEHLNERINTSLLCFSKKDVNPLVILSNFYNLNSKLIDYTKVFTDGSRSEEGCGCAAVFPNETLKFKLSSLCSSFFCEAYAIYKTLNRILQMPFTKYAIFTDSISVLLAMKKYVNVDPLIQQILNIYFQIITSNKKIIFIWIPSHIGIEGNEKADLAAKEAAKQRFHTHPLSSRDIRRYNNEKVQEMWNDTWKKLQPTKLSHIRSSLNENCQPHLETRRAQTIISRLRIGHSSLTHRHLLNKSSPPTCFYCNSPASLYHIISQCVHLNHIRLTFNLSPTYKDNVSKEDQCKRTINFLNHLNITHLI